MTYELPDRGGEPEIEAMGAQAIDASDEPRSSGGRRAKVAFALALAVVVIGVAAVVTLRGDGRDPRDELEAVLAFAEANASAAYEMVIEQEYSSGEDGLGQSGTSRAREEGTLRLPDRSRGIWRDGHSSSETIVVPGGQYTRWSDDGDLEGEQWVFTSSDDLQDSAYEMAPDEVAATAEMMIAGAAQGAGDALSSLGAPSEMVDALRKLSDLERVDGDTIRGRLDPSAMLPKDLAEQLRKHVEMALTVEISSGPEDRLDEVVIVQDMRPLTPTDEDEDDDDAMFDMLPSRAVSTITIRFRDWGETVDIAAPDPNEVDLTPDLDEEELASFDSFPIFTVAALPANWTLSAWHEEGSDEDEYCESLELTYADPDAEPTDDADGNEVYPPDLTVSMASATCPFEEEDPEGETMNVAGHEALVWTEEAYEGEAPYTTVLLTVGATSVEIYSDLPREEVIRIANSLIPFDLASQPVRRVELPPT